MAETAAVRRIDLGSRQAIESIQARYRRQTGEDSTESCSQPRRLFESLLFELLSQINGGYGCIMRLTGSELSETPFLELVSSVGRDHSGRLVRQDDTLLNRKPDALISTLLSSGQSYFANRRRGMVPACLPDCRPAIENFATMLLVTDRQSPLVVFVANSDKPISEDIVARLDHLLSVFDRIYKGRTRRKQARSAVKRHEQDHRHFSKLLEANFNGVMSIDCSGTVTAFNLACERYFDAAAIAAIGAPASQFISTDVLEPLLEQAKCLPESQRIQDAHVNGTIDSVGYRTDGSEFPIHIAAFYSRVGENVYVTLILDDISDRYESARESEQAFIEMKTLTNLAPVGILQLSAEWSCEYANDMWCNLSDLSIEESMGEGWINAIHREDVVDTLDEMHKTLCQNQTFKKEFRLHQPLGGVTWVSLNATATIDEQHRLTGFLVVVTDITEKHLAAERLRQLAHHDQLTGLVNRMFFLHRLEEFLDNIRTGENVSILSIDLDGFKLVNDTYGHDAGDFLLREVASRLNRVVRPECVTARLGGDEFIVALTESVHDNHSGDMAKEIIEAMRKPFNLTNVEVYITASVGVALCDESLVTPDELMKQADIALYRAKESGKSRAVLYTPELAAEQNKLAALNADVRDLVKQKGYVLNYQPQVDMVNQRLLGLEALLRLPEKFDPDSLPSEVIGVLEDTGLISEVGRWALCQACMDFQKFREEGLVDSRCTVSVNVSAKQLHNTSIIEAISVALDQSKLPAGLLVVELTESALIANTEETLNTINAIKSLGVKVSLDDFGTGYSSLSYLSRLPIDHLKIDKSFIIGLVQSDERLAIVQAILAMANALDITVIAEGVEDSEVVRLLSNAGCEAYQGFYFSQPMSADETRNFLHELSPIKLAVSTAFYDLGECSAEASAPCVKVSVPSAMKKHLYREPAEMMS